MHKITKLISVTEQNKSHSLLIILSNNIRTIRNYIESTDIFFWSPLKFTNNQLASVTCVSQSQIIAYFLSGGKQQNDEHLK